MKPTSDMQEACFGFRELMSFHRDSRNFVRVGDNIAKVEAMLPNSAIFHIWNDEFFSKQNCCISSMDARTKDPWMFQGCKVDWTAITGVPTGFCPDICITTVHDKVVLSVGGDDGCFTQYDELLAGIVKNISEEQN